MLRKRIAPFTQTASAESGTTVLTLTDNISTTGTPRSSGVLVPALSTVNIHISATATVVIKSNPFDDAAKDVTLATVVASGATVIASASVIVVQVTANTGTVSCLIIPNEPTEY